MKNGSQLIQLDEPEDEVTLFVNGTPVKVAKKTSSSDDYATVFGDKVTGMKGNEDLGQDITHDGDHLHYNKK